MLPINKYLPKIEQLVQNCANTILQAEPGAGKSTAVPLALLRARCLKNKQIIMLEPRKVAAKSIASYLAKSLGESVGQTIGYKIRNEHKVSAKTRLLIVTEGVLTKMIQGAPELENIGLIIFDEFHERSIHADLALMLALEVQEAYREDLKLLIMSATLNIEQLTNYIPNAATLSCPGRCFKVEIEYLGATTNIIANTMHALKLALAKQSGDILVFLPGQAEIKRCIEAASQFITERELLPLYGALPLASQELVLGKKTQRERIIFATNIAETSLTIAGITTVIDTGLEKRLIFDVKSGLSRLETRKISQAAATQRAGRAGRVQAGICYRLWSETMQQGLSLQRSDEITICDLSNYVLELAAWGLTEYSSIAWLTAPPLKHFQAAQSLNKSLGLLNKNGSISATGSKVLKVSLEPRIASVLVRADSKLAQYIALVAASILSERDIFYKADSCDLVDRILLIDSIFKGKSKIKEHQVRYKVCENILLLIKNIARNLKLDLHGFTKLLTTSQIEQLLPIIVLQAFPDRLAKLRTQDSNRYLLANGRGVSLRASDRLLKSNWLVVANCDGQNKDGLIHSAVSISIEQIKATLNTKFTEKIESYLDGNKEKIIARKHLYYQNLIISSQALTTITAADFTACIKDILLKEGLSILNWTPKCQLWLDKVIWLAKINPDFPKIDKESLIKTCEQWLLPYIGDLKTLKAVKKFNIYNLLIATLSWQDSQILKQSVPDYYLTPSGKRIKINYSTQQGATVAVVLQEMFGAIETPKIANGLIALRFELLSPARRILQTTSDLANFWQTSYIEIAKEMRGRYPKHRWPENPLLEKAGRSIKH